MLVSRLAALLLRSVGKGYAPATDLPLGLLVETVGMRGVWLLRGMFRFRRRVFLGRGVRFRHAANIKLGRFATIERDCSLDGYAQTPVRIGARTKLGAYTIVSCTSHLSKLGVGLQIGDDCGVSEYCYFGAAGGISIGNQVIMGQYVSFHSENHIFSDRDRPIRDQGVTSKGIRIGSDVWIGAKVTILDGSVVGDHSVIAAGAVVNGEYPPYSVIGGVPARVLKQL